MIDLKKDRSYKAALQPEIINVPSRLYIMIDGEGVPCPVGRQCDYQEAMELLYGITYAIKFWSKRHAIPSGYDTFTMAPVETLWWTKNGEDFGATSPDQWQWTAMLRIPSFVTETFFTEVKEHCLRSKKADSYLRVRRAQMREGKCVQALSCWAISQRSSHH